MERWKNTRSKKNVEQAIQRECKVRFSLTHSTPKMNLLLGERLHYLLDESLAEAIVTGTYNIPTNLDPTTVMISQEIGNPGMKIVNGKNNEIIITPEDFKHFLKKVHEYTALSMYGIHYGHYNAAIQDALSTKMLALQVTVIAWSGMPPESWSIGLHVMVEKIAGVCLVKKLHTIQLYEVDFNCYNQFIFGRQAMQMLTHSGYITGELFSQKGSTAKDAKFDKTLMADLS
jgi:hypothetical protein